MKLPEFPNAKYYSCRDDDELLTHDSPEEAILEHCDQFDAEDIADGVTVYCFRRGEIPKNFVERASSDFYEWINQHYLVEELCDPDGDHLPFDNDDTAALKPEVQALIQKFCDVAKVWTCEQFAKVDISGEQLDAFLRKEAPEMYAPPGAAE